MTISFTLNGQPCQIEADPSKRLVDLLRYDLGLTGTKEGCGEGECGSCTVLLDGKPVHSCLTLAGQVIGHAVTTVEGLSGPDGTLSPLQQSFIDHGAVQCGFCTPGMLLSATALLAQNPHPTRDQIKRAMSGNLCRCTGYNKIEEAILAVVNKDEGGCDGL